MTNKVWCQKKSSYRFVHFSICEHKCKHGCKNYTDFIEKRLKKIKGEKLTGVKDEVQEKKDWIDSAPYEDLLRKWRFAPSGDPFFHGAMGDYYAEKIRERRAQIGDEAHTAASKKIGWG